MSRPDWNTYFMQMAQLVATRGTCDRKKVGAVLVQGRRVIATGYNGAPRGIASCDDLGEHELVEVGGRPSCVRTLHAESNAIDWAGRDCTGAVLYTTASPCYPCAQRIVNAGIKAVYYGEWYESQNTHKAIGLFATAGIKSELLLITPLGGTPNNIWSEAVGLLKLAAYENLSLRSQIEDFLKRVSKES